MATRRERVVLDLEDNFSSGMARAAAATKLLDGALNDLDGSTVRSRSGLSGTSREIDGLGSSARRADVDIDKFSGRLALIAKTAAVLGPSLAPISAVGVAGVAALASQLGFAAVGMSSIIIAFQGVGDALKAVNEAAVAPTAENIQKAQIALEALDPAAQRFVARFQEFRPILDDIRNSAAAGFFPGLTESLDDFERIAPKVGDIMQAVGAVSGDLIADGAEALAGPEWGEFMDFVAREAPPALDAMSRSLGNVVQGAAHLWQAFDPLSDDMSSWMLDGARGFERWAEGLSETEGFQEFIEYVRENGPKVADAAVAIANAVLQIGEAAAPLGGPVLEAITQIANAIAAIADSPLGTPIMAAVTAFSAMSLAANVATASVTRLNAALAASPMAGGKGGKGIPLAGGPAGVAGLVGVLNADDWVSNIEKMLSGERNFVEGLGRMVAAGNPVGAVLQTLGVDILGTGDKAKDAAVDIEYLKSVTGGGWDTDGMELFNAALGRTADKATRAEQEVTEFTAAVERAMGILDKQAAFDAFEAAIDTARKGFKEFGETLDQGTDKGRANRQNLREIARTALTASENLRGLARVEYLEKAADVVARWGEKFGMGEKAARRFADRILGLNDLPTVEPKVDLDDTKGRAKVKQMLREMGLLDGTRANPAVDLLIQRFLKGKVSVEQMMKLLNGLKANPNADLDIGGVQKGVASARSLLTGLNGDTAHTYVITHLRTVRDAGDTAGGPPALRVGSADGGTVPKTGLSYADRHPYLLADGEEVISNRFGQADRHRSLLKAINAGRLADGGTVTHAASAGGFGGGGAALGGEAAAAAHGLRGLRAQLRETEKQLEKEREQRDRVLDKMRQTSQDVQSGLRSDLFSGDAWASSGNGSSILRGNIDQGRELARVIKRLKAKGLTGGALAEVVSQGGLTGAQQYLAMSGQELREFTRLWVQRNRVLHSVGSLAGNAAYGAQLAREQRDVRETNQHLKDIKAQLKRNHKDDRKDHKDDRDAQQRGARRTARDRGRGQ